MAGFIQNIIWNSVEGFVEAGTRSAGDFAGNALIKAGDMIENGGRGVGTSIEKKATGYGSSISGQTHQPSAKALPSTARKPVVKRSNSLPASNKPTTGTSKSLGPRPVGANKYPGGNQVNGTKRAVTSSMGTAKSTIGGVTGGVVGGGSRALNGAASSFKPAASKAAANAPKPYPASAMRSNSLPRPYSSSPYPSEKKTVVRPGQPKPFTPPSEQKKATNDGKKPYPGTNQIPGQGSRVPVQNQKQKLKPLPRLGPQVGQGQTMTHIRV
ncbi:hypothetical protein FB567DRAFT_464036 [Paraphoma chrysanthemicola]|uniref:Uncharacterized protein n=1 Tax=Paraphoma chrysanthemicola TaxID=798071 RepID=A0A8K0W0Z0_9PLEO|nr:hypothetical protein FB567DRAFT_464036 [Paraphoma chrysanthemicola]